MTRPGGSDNPLAPQAPAADLPRSSRDRPRVVRVSTRRTVTVSARVPAGSRVARIRVFRFDRKSVAQRRPGRRLLATVYRRTPVAEKTYRFRLKHRRLRNLRPGRYLVEVRTGSSRSSLGPAGTRTVRVRTRR